MKAHEIMTRDVLTISPGTPVSEVARLLTEKRISGAPVVTEDGAVLGIISEGDLLHRAETGTEKKRKWWLALFADPDAMAREYVKAHGLRASDVMSRKVVSVHADADLSAVADVLDRHRIKRVPVIRDGKLAGLITRSDLVRALASAGVGKGETRPEGGALQEAVLAALRQHPWLNQSYLNVAVSDGVVRLWGFVDSAEQRRALRVLVEEVPGVKGVEDNLHVGRPVVAA